MAAINRHSTLRYRAEVSAIPISIKWSYRKWLMLISIADKNTAKILNWDTLLMSALKDRKVSFY